ncbi:hypothetical protein ACFO8Q_05585 [Effusibacillus consociatus]|uniref:Uncharacterized protein n=1 Tax=Effusibacillus consociatus TaxID=1117041 RepID=A0ABV9PZ91_9BACL
MNVNDQGYPVPSTNDLNLDLSDERLLVPVPAAFQKIKERDLQLALSWRMITVLYLLIILGAAGKLRILLKIKLQVKTKQGLFTITHSES